MPVSVTRIIVQYAHGGELFELEFTPSAIQSIVFDKADLDRALLAQRQATGREPEQAKVPAADPFSIAGVGSIRSLGADSGEVGPPIWWHSGCSWMHPET